MFDTSKDTLYTVSIGFHLGNLLNDAVDNHLNYMKSMCKMRGRKTECIEQSLKSFNQYIENKGKIFDLKLSDDKDKILEDKILNLEFKCGLNPNVKNKNHFFLCVAMDDIREELKNYNDPIIYFTSYENDEEHECMHELLDILTFRDYFENPLKYIEIKKVEKIS